MRFDTGGDDDEGKTRFHIEVVLVLRGAINMKSFSIDPDTKLIYP